jgi:hypothetical protein
LRSCDDNHLRLDHLQSLAALDAFDPASFAAALAAELPAPATLAALEARDAALTAALAAIDDLAIRAMRLRLEQALANDASIAAPTRRVFVQTVVSYADNLELLGARARDVAARGGSRDPDATAALVTDAAGATLALREATRGPVLVLIRELATAAVADADARARDPQLPDAERKRWSAARRDLEMLAADPARITAAPFAQRIAAWPEQLDEPAPKPEPTLAELIELD